MPEIIPPLPNPFNGVSNEDLLQMQIALEYSCLRSRAAQRKPHRDYICGLGQILQDQAKKRGSKEPNFPYPPVA